MHLWAFLIRLVSVLATSAGLDFLHQKLLEKNGLLLKPGWMFTFDLLELLFLLGLMVWVAFFAGRDRLSRGLAPVLLFAGVVVLFAPLLPISGLTQNGALSYFYEARPSYTEMAGAFYLMLGFITAAQKKA